MLLIRAYLTLLIDKERPIRGEHAWASLAIFAGAAMVAGFISGVITTVEVVDAVLTSLGL